MATMELDPLFIKALALLRSKNKDSTDQLKAMLDEVLGKTTGKFSVKPEPSKSTSATAKQQMPVTEPPPRKDSLKRSAEKSNFAAALASADHIPAKRTKVDHDVRPSRIQPRKPVIDDDEDDDDDDDDGGDDEEEEDTEEEPVEEKDAEKRSHSSDDDDDDDNGDDNNAEDDKSGTADADEMWLGLACVVCQELGVSAGNQLIECQECHKLYHQKCHSPAVTDADPNDPRLVWYCAKCKRNMKKQTSKKPVNLPDSVVTTGHAGKDPEKSSDSSNSMNLFRRIEPKPSPTSTTSKQQPFGGLASYAANLAGRQPSAVSQSKTNASASRIITTGGAKTVPSSITSRSSSTSSTSTTMSGKAAVGKSQPPQRSTSISQPGSTKAPAATISANAAKVVSGTTSKAMPQASTASALKRLHMMKKKASKR